MEVSALLRELPDGFHNKLCDVGVSQSFCARRSYLLEIKRRMRSIPTTIAVGNESARNPRFRSIRAKPRSGATRRAAHEVVTPLRGFFVFLVLSVGSSRARHPRLLLFWRYAPDATHCRLSREDRVR